MLSTSHEPGVVEKTFSVSFSGNRERNMHYEAPVGYGIDRYNFDRIQMSHGGRLEFVRLCRAGADVSLISSFSIVDDSDLRVGVGIGGNAAQHRAEAGAYANAMNNSASATNEVMLFTANCDILQLAARGTRTKSSVSGEITVFLKPLDMVPAPTQMSSTPNQPVESLLQAISPRGNAIYPSLEETRDILTELYKSLKWDASQVPGFANADGIASMVSAMQRYDNDPAVQQNGMMVLHGLSLSWKEIARKFTTSSAIQRILAAMRRHVDVPTIQFHGLSTLCNLANVHDIKEILNRDGLQNIVVDLVVENLGDQVGVAFCALLNELVHANDYKLLKQLAMTGSTQATLRLLVYYDPNTDPCMRSRDTIIQHGGLNKILAVMERFPDSLMVQGCGASALLGLARSEKSELVASRDRVFKILKKAKENHTNDIAFPMLHDDLMRALSDNKYRPYYISAGLLAIALAAYLRTTGTAAKGKTPRLYSSVSK
ncbi:hypothetical protein MHU86_13616 [Fragilaria crotonensis]|nr:hypothetical protein MHU86_13616 [Fragilaria crotonensis]